jgi:hypothetical protein
VVLRNFNLTQFWTAAYKVRSSFNDDFFKKCVFAEDATMMRKFLTLIFVCVGLTAGISTRAADAKPAAVNAGVSEGEFARWLVNVLSLTRGLPAAPTEKECFAALLQNGIAPKNGWNATNLVTKGTLWRVVVQSMHKQSEVQNPQDDASWYNYLKSQKIEFGKISEAMDELSPLDPAVHSDAIVTSTDPLKKKTHFRPLDEEQLGTDMQTINRIFQVVFPPVPPVTKT